MSSTRSASPASDGGSPQQLTPRSKIKALLAAVDDSDDEGSGSKSQQQVPKIALAARGSPAHRPGNASEQSDSGEEESEEDVRPRGRLAARMLGGSPRPKTTTVAASPKQKASHTTDPDAEDASEDDDLPVAPRRLQRKAPRSPTPENAETAARPPSPSLFVSSPAQPPVNQPASDSKPELPTLKSDRFKALVERKKQERLAREAAEAAKKAERRARQEKLASEISQLDSEDGNPSDITDDEGGRKLTQEAKPTRKASKKAIEEMNRETQRMQRNMQLAHEAKTRKKISKSSLFEKFNFKPAGMQVSEEPETASSSRPGTPTSDVEMKDAETPPSSPPAKKPEVSLALPVAPDGNDDGLPTTEEILSAPSQPKKLDKGKGKAVAEEEAKTKPKRQVRVRFPLQPTVNHVSLDSDDELQVTRTETDKLRALFDNIPRKSKESKANQTLRALAHIHSPGKSNARNRNAPPGMTSGQLEASLYQKARQQSKVERDRRLELLKAQGVVVQTAEEREKEMQEVDDLVAKAREEAQQIMQQEREAAKKNKGEGDEADPLAWDDSEDEDYEDPEDPANEADAELELSGSEDEDAGEEDAENMEEERTGMFEEAAEDGDSEAESETTTPEVEPRLQSEHEEDDEVFPANLKRRRNKATVLSDDEDAVEVAAKPKLETEATPRPKTQATPTLPGSVTPGSVLRSAKKTFIPGLPVQGPAGLGMTQMFAGTMDDSQMDTGTAPTQSMMPDFDAFPDSNFSATADAAENNVDPATQIDTQADTQGVQFNFNQSQMHGLDTLMGDYIPNTQASEMEPSQDVGFQDHTPLKERFMDAPHSTVDTVVLGEEEAQESPLVRRGRLRRKMDAPILEEELEPTAPIEGTAFTAMKDAAKKEKKKADVEEFNRKKSKAKDMVEEQAEESEDEYAGLGGYDGEESDNESVASVKEMIDDAAGNDTDDRKIAAFYADRERANDEKQVEQLFKDITNGMLRRKRGADYDLSDSDDGGEARRKMKRRQFAKMQKALFSDERVKKMAENPGNQAFLKTIEDRGSDDEMDFLDYVEEPKEQDSSQEPSTQQQGIVPDSQTLVESSQTKVNPRRTKNGKKPANIGEVRQTLSNLLEDDREGSVIPATEAGSDSEDELADKEHHQPNLRRTSSVVDRLSLKRNASSNLSTSSNSRLAFTAQSGTNSSFKVPALLRRATTNSFKSTSSSTATTGSSAGGFADDAKIKKAASKRSGVSALAARESEQRKRIREGERRREEKKARGAERRVGVVGGLLGRGSFS